MCLRCIGSTTEETFAALAVQRDNGFFYGFSFDQPTLAEAERRARAEVQQAGGSSSSVVLSWTGPGCGAYRTVPGNTGSAYGWGSATTRSEAEGTAVREAAQRSGGVAPTNGSWACNSGGGEYRVLTNEPGPSVVPMIRIGTQIWGSANLSVVTYRNGDPIPYASNQAEASAFNDRKQGAWAYPEYDKRNARYGPMYNGHAMTDPRGLAPVGWRIPTDSDWAALFAHYGGPHVAGRALKGSDWLEGGGGTGAEAFNVLPQGSTGNAPGVEATFWSSTPVDSLYWTHVFHSDRSTDYRTEAGPNWYLGVRVLQGEDTLYDPTRASGKSSPTP